MFVKAQLNTRKEESFEHTLRPQTWDDYLGQKKLKDNLRVIMGAAKTRGDRLEHLLFYGSPGLGKTTLAHVIAHEMAVPMQTCTGSTIDKAGDIAALLTNLQEGEVLFLDECHRVPKPVMEMLYSALEDFRLHLVIGKGLMARTMDIELPRFTLIAATTRIALLPAPFRHRFGATFQLQFYDHEEIAEIIQRSSHLLNIHINEAALRLISSRSRATPRTANRILKRVRDFATMEGVDEIDEDLTVKALNFLGIDEKGLESADRKLLETIIEQFSGGPVGIQALAAATSEEADMILDLTEPYLLQLGLLKRTPRGRLATPLAYKHLGFSKPHTHLL